MNDSSKIPSSALLDSVTAFIRRFVALSKDQAVAITLWVAHTHVFSAADATAYLNISSAEKQSGKTRLLEVLELLVAKPWRTGRASAAVLVRKIDAECPTLLLDESDASFASDREYAEALRQVLNDGQRPGSGASLCFSQQGGNVSFRSFRVFCPKAIAGIGKLPDTVADRAIPIRLKRRSIVEKVERFRLRLVKSEAEALRRRLGEWSAREVEALRGAQPELPDALSDRQQDGAEPLLAIADSVGAQWPERGRKALIAIMTSEAGEDQSVATRVLFDIFRAFGMAKQTRLSTWELLDILASLDPRWRMNEYVLAGLLRPFGIAPDRFYIGDERVRGYDEATFLDAWGRYLPRECFHRAAEERQAAEAENAKKPTEERLPESAATPISSQQPAPRWRCTCDECKAKESGVDAGQVDGAG